MTAQGGIIRTHKDKDNPYFVADRRPFNNKELPWDSRGLLAYLLSKPDNWQIRFWDLVNQGDAKRDKMRRMLRDLENWCYVMRDRIQRDDGTFEWVSNVYENPVPVLRDMERKAWLEQDWSGLEWAREKLGLHGEEPHEYEIEYVEAVDQGKPQPSTGYPSVVDPPTDEPPTGEPAIYLIDSTTSSEYNKEREEEQSPFSEKLDGKDFLQLAAVTEKERGKVEPGRVIAEHCASLLKVDVPDYGYERNWLEPCLAMHREGCSAGLNITEIKALLTQLYQDNPWMEGKVKTAKGFYNTFHEAMARRQQSAIEAASRAETRARYEKMFQASVAAVAGA